MAELPPSPGTDWTDHERDEIGRLETLCRQIGHWKLECERTDAGDPWCVICDERREWIVLHIARIDRRYIVECPQRHRLMTMATIEEAVDIALDELIVPHRRSRGTGHG
jgi:hypothetical protein